MGFKKHLLFISIFLLSCTGENLAEGKKLTEDEQYLVLREALISYMDSLNHDWIFYNHFASGIDTTFALKILTEYETYNPIFMSVEYDLIDVNGEMFEKSEIQVDQLSGMNFVNAYQLDSIRRIAGDDYSFIDTLSLPTLVYCLHRPFKPDTSSLVLIEVSPLTTLPWCADVSPKFLIIEKVYNKWSVKREL